MTVAVRITLLVAVDAGAVDDENVDVLDKAVIDVNDILQNIISSSERRARPTNIWYNTAGRQYDRTAATRTACQSRTHNTSRTWYIHVYTHTLAVHVQRTDECTEKYLVGMYCGN